jgi:ATP:corrinoid adenosyltransferase
LTKAKLIAFPSRSILCSSLGSSRVNRVFYAFAQRTSRQTHLHPRPDPATSDTDMARMHPPTLFTGDVKSPAEAKVFDLLREGLGDDWDVFHSVSWVRRDKRAGSIDGEIDFVLAHPREGIVVLEVKGGDIECRFGAWSHRVDGVMERMEDPFQQALDHRYDLQRLVHRPDWLVVQCVALPDVTVQSLQLAPDAPRPLILDRHDVEDPGSALDRVLAFHRGQDDRRGGPGAGGIDKLHELFAPTVELRVPIAEAFRSEEQELVRLTDEQARALRNLRRTRRMAVYGCAGSGKTMLAVEHAKRLAEQGLDVLFVCFNKALGAHLHRTEKHDKITFQHFHGLCVKLIREAGIAIEFPDEDADPAAAQAFWRDTVPDLFVEALDTLGPRWDALIVDEAQDLHGHWLDALQLALRDDAHAPIWLFLDDNQRIYEGMLEVPADFAAYELSTNCRTTQAIHRELLKLYAGDVSPDARGPEGRRPEIRHAADQAAAVENVVDGLLDGDVPPEQVVVLSSHGRDNSAVREKLRSRFVDDRAKARGRKVLFSSIRAFKGLESSVVVLCELEDLATDSMDAQLYVGMSRARNHCVIVAPPAA